MSKPNASIHIIDDGSYDELERRITFILMLLDHEYHNAHTHAQRNNYVAVARHELEQIETDMNRWNGTHIDEPSDIPF